MTSPLAQHRLGSRLGFVLALAAAIIPFAGSAAQAAPPKPPPSVVTANDAYVQSRCSFTVTSVNYAAGTLRGRLTSQTRASNYAAASSTAHVSVGCELYNAGFGVLLSQISDENNGIATRESHVFQVPLYASYDTCVSGVYTLRNGNTTGFSNCS